MAGQGAIMGDAGRRFPAIRERGETTFFMTTMEKCHA
jgi:hypothetical protein